MKTNLLIGLMLLLSLQSLAQSTWYKYPANPVFKGTPGEWDNNILPKVVIYENDEYHMWYNGMGPGIVAYGYATSPDGINWNKNDDNKLEFNSIGSPWELWIGSFDILKIDSMYCMWYVGGTPEDNATCIGFATSTDGLNWTKHADPVLKPSSDIKWEVSGFSSVQVIYDGIRYHMWYSGRSAGIPVVGRTGYATSEDRINWTKYHANPVLDIGEAGSWEDHAAMMHTVIFNGSDFEMWYHGGNLVQHEIGYASSPDGKNWVKSEENPLVKAGEVGEWDAWLTTYPVVIKQDSVCKMWYYGHNNTIGSCGYATTSLSESNAWDTSIISKSQRVIRVQVLNKVDYIKVDSLEEILPTLSGIALINAYNQLALAFSLNKGEKSLEYAEKALKLSGTAHYPEGKAMAYYSIGNLQYVLDNYTDALVNQLKALRLFDSLGMILEQGNLITQIAGIHISVGSYDLAIKYYDQALKLYESQQDTSYYINSLKSLGYANLDNGDTAAAIKAFNRRLTLAKENKNIWNQAEAYQALGMCYSGRCLDSAMYYYWEAKPLWDTLNPGYLDYNFLLTAEAYYAAGPEYYKLAEEFFLESYVRAGNGRHIQVRLLYGMAELYFNTGRYNDARKFLGVALYLCQNYLTKQNHQMFSYLNEKLEYDQFLRPFMEKIYRLYYRIDTATNNRESAFEYYTLATQWKDSIVSQQNRRQWAMLQGQYETESANNLIALLEKDNELKNLTIRKSRVYLFGLGALAFIIILAAIIFIRNRRIKAQYAIKMERMSTEKLRELDHLKSMFFANISHEFRTPLTLIMGPLKTLLSNSSDQSEMKNLNLAIKYAKHLQQLINQLLAISKLESGKMQLKTSNTNIVKMLSVYLQAFESLARQKNISLKFNFEKEEIHVYVDREKFEQILNNLLSNAFKYTEADGRIVVDLVQQHQTITDQGVKYVEIKISDTGYGISPEHIDHIFDRFYQVDHLENSYYEGSGIGLALTKELVELHSGMIMADSEQGKGTSFTILLPLGREHLKADEIEEDKHEEIPSPPFTVSSPQKVEDVELQADFVSENNNNQHILLIVEDNADMRAHIRGFFENEFNIVEAIDGADGYAKSTQHIPDIIISDLMMPNMDGNEFCRKVKMDERTSHIPVILLTAKVSKESRIEGLETGADDFINKPFDGEELKVRVENLIQQRERIRQVLERKIEINQGVIQIDFANSGITSMDERFIQKVIEVIEKRHIDPEFNTKTLSLAIGLGRIQLNRKIKALTGQTTGGFIRTFRLKRAAELIKNKSATIAEIAYDVGFNSSILFY